MLETYINSREYLPKESEFGYFQNWLNKRVIQMIDTGEILLRGGYQYYSKFQMMDLVTTKLPKQPTPIAGYGKFDL